MTTYLGTDNINPSSLPRDTFLFVSGTTGLTGSNAKVTVFGGDVVVSGTLTQGGSPVGGGGNQAVAFDANDLFCWQTVENVDELSFINRVLTGATATLYMSSSYYHRTAGAIPAVNSQTESSYLSSTTYDYETPRGAQGNNPPTNNFTIDWYFMPFVNADAMKRDLWVWQKRRVAPSWNDADAAVGMIMRYADAGQTSNTLLEWECRARLTSGNACRYATNLFQYGTTPIYKLSPHVWYHMGFTVSLDAGDATTSLIMYFNGTRTKNNDSATSTHLGITGTAVDFTTAHEWELFGRFTATFDHCSALGCIQRLRVSNIVRPASYFRAAARALR